MNSYSKPPSITIEEVAQAFAKWRSTKVRKNQRIPSKLKGLIKQLIPFYKKNTIIKTLGISRNTFSIIAHSKNNNNCNNNSDDNNNHQLNFIPLTFDTQDQNIESHNNNPYCEIIHPKGSKLLIYNPDINAVINSFLCCN
jgi:hypothetical protein